MLKKALWFIVITVMPLMILYIFKCLRDSDGVIALSTLYISAIVLVIVAANFKPCSLFALPAGFALAGLMFNQMITLRSGFDITDIIYFYFYSIPFIIITSIIAIVGACRKDEY